MSSSLPAGHLKVRDGTIVWADQGVHQWLGHAPGTLAGTAFADLFEATAADGHPDGGRVDRLRVPAQGAVGQSGVTLRNQCGFPAAVVDLSAERMDDRSVLWSVSPNARAGRTERLDMLSRHDALTRLPNRIPSLHELRQNSHAHGGDAGRVLAVCYLDLDGFRNVNDRLGPAGGDAVLREVARRLRTAVPPDATVARVGGDEFALVLSFDDPLQCEALLSQVLAVLAEPFRTLDHSARLRASIGVALMTLGEEPTEVMLQHAQHAVFFAKRAGGGRTHYFDVELAFEEQEELQFRQRIERGLRHNEFFLAYQPKVDMQLGRVVGVEALVRWQHPERGLLQPDAFVTFIEDHALVEELGDWVIGEAVRQAARWYAVGLAIPVSVNISPRHLLRHDFIARLVTHLAQFPARRPGVLELEILETTAIKDFAAVAHFIEACQALGVSVTMDDFGTGYSSLTCLRQLPVSTIKLDRSFVLGMVDDVEDRAIVEGILVMARGLGLKVIAEGVESAAHGEALLALGCTLGQGYGIARPMPAGQVPDWIAAFEATPLKAAAYTASSTAAK